MSKNARNRRNRPCLSMSLAGLVLVALTAACNSPTAPSPNPLEIVVATTIAPQQTTEVQAFLVSPNGRREDVTPRVTWSTSDSTVLTTSSSGRVTGGTVGEATLRATLDNLTASTTVIVVPPGTFRLAGVVRGPESATPISGAQVELIPASGEVLTTQTTGAAGFRFYGVAGQARLRISRRTFRPYDVEIDIRDHLTHNASLFDFSGSYTLTLSASQRCRAELPEHVRTRKYDARIAQTGSSLVLTLPDLIPWWQDGFSGGFDENDDFIFQLDQVREGLGGGDAFLVSGRMTGTTSGGELSGFLDGDMVMEERLPPSSRIVTCTAPDHSAVFSR